MKFIPRLEIFNPGLAISGFPGTGTCTLYLLAYFFLFPSDVRRHIKIRKERKELNGCAGIKQVLREFAPWKGIRIPESGNYCLWDPESRTLKFGIQLKESGILLTIGIRNPISADRESWIQFLKFRIQDCLEFPYMGRENASFWVWYFTKRIQVRECTDSYLLTSIDLVRSVLLCIKGSLR